MLGAIGQRAHGRRVIGRRAVVRRDAAVLLRWVARVALVEVLVVTAGVAGCAPLRRDSVSVQASPPAATPGRPTESVDPAGAAAAIVQGFTDADLVGQVLMPSVRLADPPAASAALLTTYRLGSVILMGDVQDTAAGGTAAQVRTLTDTVRAAGREVGAQSGLAADPLVATDQEYGWVTRIKSGLVQLPSAMAFGAADRPDLTEAAWRGAGTELAAVGINVDLAPDADVIGPAGNQVIGSRSYGSDPAAVSRQVAAVVKGLQSTGVAATVKHFPGHGHTTTNSHVALPVLGQTRAELARTDLPPFQTGIGAGAWLVMSGHLAVKAIDPGVPASFSSKVLVDLLRGELKFDGVVVTDALNMEPAMRWPAGEAAVRALLAGNDLLLMPPDLAAAHQGLTEALASGQLPRSRLVEAATRVVALRLRLAAAAQPDLSMVDVPAHREAALAVAAAAVTVLRGPCRGALVQGPVRVTAAAGREQAARWLASALAEQGLSVVDSGGQVVHLLGYGDSADDLAAAATVTVGMDTPYVLRSATSPVRLATYSSTQVAMQALAAVLAGRATAAGRSPVAVAGLPSAACADP